MKSYPFIHRSLFCLCSLSLLFVADINIACAQTATTQVIDFLVADGTWERAETRYPNQSAAVNFDPNTPENWVRREQGPEVESFMVTTRAVDSGLSPGAVDIGATATFSGLAQQANGVLQGHGGQANNYLFDDPTAPTEIGSQDFVLDSFSNATNITNFSRFSSTNDDDFDGVYYPTFEGSRPASAIQWNFDLAPLESYLSTNSLNLDALEANLNVSWALGNDRFYDVLLSYTNESEGIQLGNISMEIDENRIGAFNNYEILFKPSRTATDIDAGTGTTGAPGSGAGALIGDDPRTIGAEGDFDGDLDSDGEDFLAWQRGESPGGAIADDLTAWTDSYGAVGGGVEPNTHKVIAQNLPGGAGEFFPPEELTTSIDLLSLYEDGVREFNLVVVASAFAPNFRPFSIRGPEDRNGSGGPNVLSEPLSFGSGVYINTSPAAVSSSTAVPEPTTYIIVLCGLAALATARSRMLPV